MVSFILSFFIAFLTQLFLGNHQASLPLLRNNQVVLVTYRPTHLHLPNLVGADGIPFNPEVVDLLGAFAKSLGLLGQDLLPKYHHLWRRRLSVYKPLARGQPGKVRIRPNLPAKGDN